jgi:hypothetical protein
MSLQIDAAMVNAYRANVSLLVQQKGSRLRPFVRTESQNAEFEFYDRIGATEAQEITGRHQDTPLQSTPHDRRRVSLRDFDWADLIDRQDKLKMLMDPASAYSQNAVYAMGRKMDDMIIAAAFDSAYSGKTGATTVAFPAANQIAVNYVETGGAANSNLTIGKLRRAKELLDAYDNDPDEERIMTCTANSMHSLLRNTEVTSADYNTVRALVEGKLDTYLGFKFVRTQRLLTNGSGHRRHIAWIKSKLLLAVSQEPMIDVGPRRDKRNSVQVYVNMGIGATRMEEEGVVEVLVDESVL